MNSEIKQRVRNILEINNESRDSDRLLISIIWEQDSSLINGKYYFLEMLKNGDLTNPESIRRCRQKLQEQDENLRGLKYKTRKQLGEEVRQSIKNL